MPSLLVLLLLWLMLLWFVVVVVVVVVVCCLLFVVWCSVLCCPFTAVCFLLSVLRCLLSVACCLVSAVRCPLSLSLSWSSSSLLWPVGVAGGVGGCSGCSGCCGFLRVPFVTSPVAKLPRGLHEPASIPIPWIRGLRTDDISVHA